MVCFRRNSFIENTITLHGVTTCESKNLKRNGGQATNIMGPYFWTLRQRDKDDTVEI